MALGVAKALHYLHIDTSRPVIHRDVKSSNILLSDDFEPQVKRFQITLYCHDLRVYVLNIALRDCAHCYNMLDELSLNILMCIIFGYITRNNSVANFLIGLVNEPCYWGGFGSGFAH